MLAVPHAESTLVARGVEAPAAIKRVGLSAWEMGLQSRLREHPCPIFRRISENLGSEDRRAKAILVASWAATAFEGRGWPGWCDGLWEYGRLRRAAAPRVRRCAWRRFSAASCAASCSANTRRVSAYASAKLR